MITSNKSKHFHQIFKMMEIDVYFERKKADEKINSDNEFVEQLENINDSDSSASSLSKKSKPLAKDKHQSDQYIHSDIHAHKGLATVEDLNTDYSNAEKPTIQMSGKSTESKTTQAAALKDQKSHAQSRQKEEKGSSSLSTNRHENQHQELKGASSDYVTDMSDEYDRRFAEVSLDENIVKEKEDPSVNYSDAKTNSDLDELKQKVAGCEACSLSLSRKNVVFGLGNTNAKLMIVLNGPNKHDDGQNLPVSLDQEKLLEAMLKSINLTFDDVFITNVYKCYSPISVTSVGDEVMQCLGHLNRQITILRPKLIWSLGDLVAQVLLTTDLDVIKLRGKIHHYMPQNQDLISDADGQKPYPLIVSPGLPQLLKDRQFKKLAWADLQKIKRFLQTIR